MAIDDTDAPQDFSVLLAEHQICIVGLGLMGASLAQALQGHVRDVIAIDPDPETQRIAIASGLIARVQPALNSPITANIVVLAAPVRANLAILKNIAQWLAPQTVVLDLGSTKVDTVEAMSLLPPTLSAVGGHPMCGKSDAGITAANATLFRDQTFVLCRTKRTTPSALSLAEAVVRAIGAKPLRLSAAKHDEIVADLSHLPYLLATILTYAAARPDEKDFLLASTGYQGASRLAGSDPQMFRDILLTNREPILRALATAQRETARVSEILRAGDPQELLRYCAAAQSYYKAQSHCASMMTENTPAQEPTDE